MYQVLLSSTIDSIYVTNNNLLPEAICCCLQMCNVVTSEVMVGNASN